MNLRTTLILFVLIAVGGVAWWFVATKAPATASSPTIAFLEKEMTPDKLTRIEVQKRGEPAYVLEKVGGEWMLPGKWPVRSSEAQHLVRMLTTLHSRFAPHRLDKGDLERLGLTGDAGLTLKLTVGGKNVTVRLGEEASERNRFTRATFLRLDDSGEVVRLGPGLIASLDRTQDYFQQRRLFVVERVPKDDDSPEKIEQVAATEIQVKGPEGEFTITRSKSGTRDEWLVTAPVKDQVDPEKLRGILTNLTDLWADRFVLGKGKKLDEMGLDRPEYTLRVSRPGGDITVLVGKVSESKDRIVTKPAPPQQSPFAPPPKPSITVVKEEYRYAKLPDNDQIFEIKTDKLKDVAPPLSEVRDARVARFKTDDVRKIAIEQGGQSLVLTKDKDKWKVEKPTSLDAENQPITELLDKLSALEAKGGDVRDKADPKEVGLDKGAAKVTLTLEETKKTKAGEEVKETKTPRTLVYDLGVSPKEKAKVFVKLAGWPRVNAVGDDVLKLVQRDVLAYRQRRVLDVAADDLSKIRIARGKEELVLERKDGAWSLVQPVSAKADASKADQLVGDLTRLEATEYVAAAPKAEELDKTFGLAKPELKATLTFTDAKKAEKTLIVGKQRPFKDDYFARLDDGPVMVVKKEIRDLLDRDSLAYRPTQAWQVAADKIVELRVKKEGEPYTLLKQDKVWRIISPFDATARKESVEAMTDELGQLKSEKYVAQGTKDLAKFGLDKPHLQIDVVTRSDEPMAESKDDAKNGKKDDKTKVESKKDTAKTKDMVVTLHVGKMDESGKSRYARIGEADAIFLVGDKALAALDHGPLDLLDRSMLSLDSASIEKIRFTGKTPFTLEKKKGDWQVTGSPAPPFTAEESVVRDLLRPWDKLSAEKIAAYGPKVDWVKFGLDKPATTITVSLGEKDKKAVEHKLTLGNETEKGKRYARLDQQPAVAVLGADVVKDLIRDYLDFVDPRVLKFPFDAVSSVERKMKDGDLELVKRDDAWQVAKPLQQSADNLTADDIIEKTFQLKAKSVAAYPAKDLKPFGLDQPAATVTIVLNDGKKHVIEVGSVSNPKESVAEERYARVNKGDRVVVLPAILSRHLTAPVPYFADRNVASLASADRVELQQGERKLVFIKSGSSWKVVDPVKTDAEDNLGDFVQTVLRLRADEIVAGKGADLKSFGLEKPSSAWRLFSGDKEVLDLQIGDPEKAKEKDSTPRRYARLAKGDQVFLLSTKASSSATAEYRKRKPWDSLDAAQVDQLTVTGPSGAFTLRKSDGNWTVADKADSKVNGKAVTDTLDALAGLKAERFVADIKGDLQLHGLKPPQWKLELKTLSGSRTLLVGRAEGSSQRHYAAVTEGDAIFVLSEDDSRRLLRPLAEYVDEKGKQ